MPYPMYEVLTIDDTTFAVEHRRMEPEFYIVTDAAILRRLGVP